MTLQLVAADGIAPVMPSISDSYTVSTEALCKASGRTEWTLWKQRKKGNLGPPKKRKGVYGNWYTPAQANKFLKRIGRAEVF